MPKSKGSYGGLESAINLYNHTGRPVGERMNNPQAEKPMREVNCMDEATKDGAYVMTKMGMGIKK